MDKCPKCGKKLSMFYVKQTCNECGCDILYYDMEKRLEADAEQAEKEFAALEKLLGKLTGILDKIKSLFSFKKK